jgi:hypothetical protein
MIYYYYYLVTDLFQCALQSKNVLYMSLLHTVLDVEHVIGSIGCAGHYSILMTLEQENRFYFRKQQSIETI